MMLKRLCRSHLAPFAFNPVTFAIRGRYCYVPGYLLFTAPSIFTSFLHCANGDGMKAAIQMVEDAATSAKVFDLVFQPLLYGYLDVDEINEMNKQEQSPLGLLVDGLKLADKIQAAPVVSLIQEELVVQFEGPGSVTISGIKKLFEARPMTDGFLFRYLSHGASLFQNPRVLQAARQKVTGFTEFDHTYLSTPNSEEARNAEQQKGVQAVNMSEEVRNDSLEVNAETTDNDIANYDSGGVSDYAADAETQSESTVKRGKRPVQDQRLDLLTEKHANEEGIEANAMSTAERDQLQARSLNDPTSSTQFSQEVEAGDHPHFSTVPTTPEPRKPSITIAKSNMKQPVGSSRETRGTKRKVAFDNEPQIHPISSPVDVPSLPKPAIIDLKEGPPSHRLRQRGPTPSGTTPGPQHDEKAKAVEKKASPPKRSRKAPAKDATKALETAKSRTKATSKTRGSLVSTPRPGSKAKAPAKATVKPPKNDPTPAPEEPDKRRATRSKDAE